MARLFKHLIFCWGEETWHAFKSKICRSSGHLKRVKPARSSELVESISTPGPVAAAFIGAAGVSIGVAAGGVIVPGAVTTVVITAVTGVAVIMVDTTADTGGADTTVGTTADIMADTTVSVDVAANRTLVAAVKNRRAESPDSVAPFLCPHRNLKQQSSPIRLGASAEKKRHKDV